MIKTFIFVEDGSVDLDELKSSVGDDVLVIPYRQGATPPAIQQPREPVSRREVNIKDRLLDLMIEFDEMGFAPTTVCEDAEGLAVKWKELLLEEIKALESDNGSLRNEADENASLSMENKMRADRLEAENAALREQISKMIMPPCTLGDTLYITSFCFGDGYDEAGNAVHTSGWQITETKVDEKNFYKMCDLVRNKKAFFSREAAVARLAELEGE